MEAAGGNEAVNLLNTRRFDLLITDTILPNIGGYKLATRARLKWPDIPVIFTGFLTDVRADGILKPPVEFLQKPIDAGQLTESVQRMLLAR